MFVFCFCFVCFVETGLTQGSPPASASQVVELQVQATVPSFFCDFIIGVFSYFGSENFKGIVVF